MKAIKNYYEERAKEAGCFNTTYLSTGVAGKFYRYRSDTISTIFHKYMVLKKEEGFVNNIRELILDLGCVNGWYLKRLSKYEETVGLDISKGFLLKARNFAKTSHFVNADAGHIPFRETIFNYIICTEVLEHLPNPNFCIQEIFRVLRNNGMAIITSPMKYSMMEILGRKNSHKHNIEHINVFTYGELVRNLNSKFKILETHAILFLPLISLVGLIYHFTKLIKIIDKVCSKIPFFKNFSWCVILVCLKN
jgi:SAM-dependent methyltransferase